MNTQRLKNTRIYVKADWKLTDIRRACLTGIDMVVKKQQIYKVEKMLSRFPGGRIFSENLSWFIG
jgi:hypothetical protein